MEDKKKHEHRMGAGDTLDGCGLWVAESINGYIFIGLNVWINPSYSILNFENYSILHPAVS